MKLNIMKNNKLKKAMLKLCSVSAQIKMLEGTVVRQKVESHPTNNHTPFYKEVHYRALEEDFEKMKNELYFSRNQNGTLFATERFFGENIVHRLKDRKFIIEDVILDTNPDWYFKMSQKIYNIILDFWKLI